MRETLAEMGREGAEVAEVAGVLDPNDVLDSADIDARKDTAESEASLGAVGALITA